MTPVKKQVRYQIRDTVSVQVENQIYYQVVDKVRQNQVLNQLWPLNYWVEIYAQFRSKMR
jgi:hypothetical protein